MVVGHATTPTNHAKLKFTFFLSNFNQSLHALFVKTIEAKVFKVSSASAIKNNTEVFTKFTALCISEGDKDNFHGTFLIGGPPFELYDMLQTFQRKSLVLRPAFSAGLSSCTIPTFNNLMITQVL